MIAVKEVVYSSSVPRDIVALLTADIGGTNGNFGVFALHKESYELIISLHVKTQEVTHFTHVVKDIITYVKSKYGITFINACFAVAGVVSDDRTFCKPTNLCFTIETQDIMRNTSLKSVFLVNDFAVIGYGLSAIKPESIVQVKDGIIRNHANKVIVGAGTGLGKSIMLWDESRQRYISVVSEGGHSDFAVHDMAELDLIHFIQKDEEWNCPVSWEDILSGNGIKRMYNYFRHHDQTSKTNRELAQNGFHPDMIFSNRTRDDHAWRTYQWYAKFYARCVKNMALETLAQAGVYIAGGIAAKNVELFQEADFLDEFIKCGKQQSLLQEIPLFVVTDYNVSLYGVAEYIRLEGYCSRDAYPHIENRSV